MFGKKVIAVRMSKHFLGASPGACMPCCLLPAFQMFAVRLTAGRTSEVREAIERMMWELGQMGRIGLPINRCGIIRGKKCCGSFAYGKKMERKEGELFVPFLLLLFC